MALYVVPLPKRLGAATCLPPCGRNQSAQSAHQLPGCSVAPCSHSACSLGSLSLVQYERFFLTGGLITPAMCPDAPITKRLLPGRWLTVAYAEPIGTMWSSR